MAEGRALTRGGTVFRRREEDLRMLFVPHAPLRWDPRIVRYEDTGRAVGFASFHSVEDAAAALQALQAERKYSVFFTEELRHPPRPKRTAASDALEAAQFLAGFGGPAPPAAAPGGEALAAPWEPREFDPARPGAAAAEAPEAPEAGTGTAGREEAPPEEEARYVWDAGSGYYYDRSTGMFYDQASQLHYEPTTGAWLRYDYGTGLYERVEVGAAAQPAAQGQAQGQAQAAEGRRAATIGAQERLNAAGLARAAQRAPREVEVVPAPDASGRKVVKVQGGTVRVSRRRG